LNHEVELHRMLDVLGGRIAQAPVVQGRLTTRSRYQLCLKTIYHCYRYVFVMLWGRALLHDVM